MLQRFLTKLCNEIGLEVYFSVLYTVQPLPQKCLYRFINKQQFLQTVFFTVKATNYNLTKFTPKTYFGSKLMHGKLFLNQPYFGQNNPTNKIKFLQTNNTSDFD